MLTDFKGNPIVKHINIQKLTTETYGVVIPKHTCDRAKNLLKSWVDGKHEDSYARLAAYVEEIKTSNLRIIASCISQWSN